MNQLRFCAFGVLMVAAASRSSAADGFATGTTGGSGGPVVTVTNGTDFIAQADLAGPRIIQVQGAITIGSVEVNSDTSIIGLGTNAAIVGRLAISGISNVIVQNLRITSQGNDGISIRDPGTHHVWVDHCTFYDCSDGSCDISQGADYVTVSWCKFSYPTQLEHKFATIADGTASGQGHITLHHNWWSTGADQRMPASSYGTVHMYNNYWNCTNNSYCSNARTNAQFLSESNYYAGVEDPIYKESTGKIRTSGNIYVDTSGIPYDSGTDTVFTPPYSYAPDNAADVTSIVPAGAGAPGPDTIPIPPKIWDGGGGTTNWNTANNWALDEIPRAYDALVFAGNVGLTANNNLSSANNNRHLYGLAFSNTAGAFVLSGSTINLGGPITDDSASTQTLNLNMDFAFGIDHYTPNRVINVSSNTGSLIINGNIAGAANGFFSTYSLTKQGPGTLTLNGNNSFSTTFTLNDGFLVFGIPGSLGVGTSITFNGGGLRWGAANTMDISTRTVTINSGGATIDTGGNTVTFTNRIGNNGLGGLTKTGAGMLIFNATNNYRGNTIIAGGVLALGAAGLLTNSPQIILTNDATLDVSDRADKTLALTSRQTLKGNGTVLGSVTNSGTLSPGFSIGTLMITNRLTFQAGGTNVMELDADAGTNDVLRGMSGVTYGGRLIVTNLNGTLAVGDSFKLFDASSYNASFSSIALPPLTGTLFWTNRLALDGTLAVASPVNTTPTNITITVVSNTLQLLWPQDHTGWRLQVQTNLLETGLNTNWIDVPQSDLTNAASLPVDAANGSVFFRLIYP